MPSSPGLLNFLFGSPHHRKSHSRKAVQQTSTHKKQPARPSMFTAVPSSWMYTWVPSDAVNTTPRLHQASNSLRHERHMPDNTSSAASPFQTPQCGCRANRNKRMDLSPPDQAPLPPLLPQIPFLPPFYYHPQFAHLPHLPREYYPSPSAATSPNKSPRRGKEHEEQKAAPTGTANAPLAFTGYLSYMQTPPTSYLDYRATGARTSIPRSAFPLPLAQNDPVWFLVLDRREVSMASEMKVVSRDGPAIGLGSEPFGRGNFVASGSGGGSGAAASDVLNRPFVVICGREQVREVISSFKGAGQEVALFTKDEQFGGERKVDVEQLELILDHQCPLTVEIRGPHFN